MVASVTLPGVLRSPGVGRQWAALVLEASGHTHIDLVLLVLSELVANAVTHSRSRNRGGQITVRLMDIGHQIVEVEVIDDGSRNSVPHMREPDDWGGRGLLVVEAASAKWGVREAYGGRTAVWAHLVTTAERVGCVP
ncbi:ATP-binding protein [Thermocatellispora tengchongensis]|uniref:ATP-binding protein n=1 Tax=Thermocatellispora tengchongensis TaxID=1073253 RepID=UPI001619F9B5